MKKAQKQRALQNPLIDLTQLERYSPVDMLLTQYYTTDPRPFYQIRQSILNELHGTPELKWLMLAMAYWGFVGVDNVLDLKHRVGRRRHRLKVIEAGTVRAGDHESVHGFYSNKHSVYLSNDKGEVVQTLIHEMTHGLAKILYENYSDPYSKLDEQEKFRWMDRIKSLIEHLKKKPEAIDQSGIFVGIGQYDEAHYPSEMIARIFEHYIKAPNEDFTGLPHELREFILLARAEFVRRTRQWCQNFASDVGLHLLPGNEQYLANIQGELILTKSGLTLLQQARDNGDMSVLEFRLNQLAQLEDSDNQYAGWLKITSTTPEVSIFRAACKFPAISQLVEAMGERGAGIDMSMLPKSERLKGLFLAARYGNAHWVERLLSLSNVHISDIDQNGHSIFYWLGFDHNQALLMTTLKQLDSEIEKAVIQAVAESKFDHDQAKLATYLNQLNAPKEDAILQAMTAALQYGQVQMVTMLLEHYPAEAEGALETLNARFCSWREVQKLSPAFLALDTKEAVESFLERQILDFTVMLRLALVHGKSDLLVLLLQSGRPLEDHLLVKDIVQQAVTNSWPNVLDAVIDLVDYYPDEAAKGAISKGTDFETLQWLLQSIPDISQTKSRKGENLLHRLVGGRPMDMEWLLGPDGPWPIMLSNTLSEKNIYGETPLIKAIAEGDFRFASDLLAYGPAIQLLDTDKKGLTPLMLALDKGEAELALQIIQKSPVSVLGECAYGGGVVQLAVARGLDQVISYLIDHRADEEDYREVLEEALERDNPSMYLEALANGHVALAETLAALKPPPHCEPKTLIKALKTMVRHPMPIERLDELMGSVELDDKAIGRMIQNAIKAHQADNLRLLVRRYPEFFTLPRYFKGCIRLGDAACMQVLATVLPDELRPQLGIIAAEYGKAEYCPLFFDTGVDVNAVDHPQNRETALHRAAMNGHLGMVQALLEHADIKIDECTMDGMTPFYLAVQHGKEDVALALLEQGAYPLIYPVNAASPLMFAVKHQMQSLALALLTHQQTAVDWLKQTDENKATVLHHAVLQDNPELVHVLLSQGADPEAKDEHGVSPIELAMQINNPRVIRRFVSALEHRERAKKIRPHGALKSRQQPVADSGASKRERLVRFFKEHSLDRGANNAEKEKKPGRMHGLKRSGEN